MRNQRGITLIALVITIIVLLILAGVSIAMLTGNNGILTRARGAEDSTEIAEVVDKVNMAIQAAYITHVSNNVGGQMPVSDVIAQYVEDNGASSMKDDSNTSDNVVIVTTDSGKFTVTLQDAGDSYTVNNTNVDDGNAD